MFGLTMQHFGDFRKIDESGFFGAHFDHLWWAHDEFLFLAHDGIRIFVLDDVVHSLEELIVGIVPVVVGPSRSIFLFLCKNKKINEFFVDFFHQNESDKKFVKTQCIRNKTRKPNKLGKMTEFMKSDTVRENTMCL